MRYRCWGGLSVMQLVYYKRLAVGCAKRRQGRSIDLIILVSLPVGRSSIKPSILAPFYWPNAPLPRPSAASPAEQIRVAVAKVRRWAKALESGDASSLAAVAKREGVSTARVSQLLILNRITDEQLEPHLKRLKRVSLRGLIRSVRGETRK